jgi:glycosyltransferase involved in cell wall biosynthesis
MTDKPTIVFTFPACMGGVSSFNYNIINHSKRIKNFHSRVIMLKAAEDTRPLFLDSFNADEVIRFDYSFKENQYAVQKRLNSLLGAEQGAIVTDNTLTLQSARAFTNRKTVFHLIHDYFYVSQAIAMGDMADAAIAHSSFFSDAVFASNPSLFANRSFYIPYGVQQLAVMPVKNNPVLRLVFLGRLDEAKGVLTLYEIEQGLKAKNIEVQWTVIGKGPLKDVVRKQWEKAANISFYEPDSTEAVYELLGKQDIFIFPTTFEGTPVSILECMANGVVTLCNDLPGGIRDIVNEHTGHRCRLNDIGQFIEHITFYHTNSSALQQLQQECFWFSKAQYDIEKNADGYFSVFSNFAALRRKEKTQQVTMSRLDRSIFPNGIVKLLRSIR